MKERKITETKTMKKIKKGNNQGQAKRGKPQGLKNKEKEMPPSGIWSSHKPSAKVILILTELARFSKTHDAGSRVGENNENRERRERKSPQEIEVENQALLAEIAQQCDACVINKVCFIFLFRKEPIKINSNEEIKNIEGFENLKDNYKEILMQTRNLFAPKFLKELIYYFQYPPIDYGQLVDSLLTKSENKTLQKADTLLQLAFMRHIYKKKQIEIDVKVDTLYEQFINNNRQEILDLYEQVLLSFEEQEEDLQSINRGDAIIGVEENQEIGEDQFQYQNFDTNFQVIQYPQNQEQQQFQPQMDFE